MIKTEWQHYFTEFRSRLIKCLVFLVVLFALFFSVSKTLFSYLAIPLLNHLPHDGKLIATTVTAPFLVPIKLSFLLALFIGMPFYLYQLWAFITPALYKQERSLLLPVLIFSSFLFYLGALFAYFIFLPLVFRFLISMAPTNVAIMTDISHYLDFVVRFFFAFGIAFEVPVVVLLLLHSGVVSMETMEAKRPYVIVIAFVLGMLLTPPDLISQILLAIPIWLLYEVGIMVAKLLGWKRSYKANSI